MTDEDRIVEIGARTLFDDWQAARGQLYGHKAMKWDREPHHQKRFRSQCRAVLAAFEEAGLVVEQGWQPIETAPKDGTVIDLWAYDQKHDRWGRRPDCAWERMADWDGAEFEGWAGLQRGTWWSCEWVSPSHWRALPAPPAAKADPQ